MEFVNVSLCFERSVVDGIDYGDILVFLTTEKPESAVGALKLTHNPSFKFPTDFEESKVTAVKRNSTVSIYHPSSAKVRTMNNCFMVI